MFDESEYRARREPSRQRPSLALNRPSCVVVRTSAPDPCGGGLLSIVMRRRLPPLGRLRRETFVWVPRSDSSSAVRDHAPETGRWSPETSRPFEFGAGSARIDPPFCPLAPTLDACSWGRPAL